MVKKLKKYSPCNRTYEERYHDPSPTMEEDNLGGDHYNIKETQGSIQNIIENPKYDYDYAQILKDVLDLFEVPYDA